MRGDFIHKYFGVSGEEIEDMLLFLEISDINDLFGDIPNELRLTEELDIPSSMDEIEVKRHISSLLMKNKSIPPNKVFLGGGVWPINIPSAVRSMINRTEFLTAYTPYQPETSQGVLQALYEYQSLISILTGLEVVNASMYDWGSSAAEALLMALRYTRRNKVIIAGLLSPERLEVINTYLWPHNIDVRLLDWSPETGLTPIELIDDYVDKDTAALYIEVPSFIGSIETNIREIAEILHRRGILFVMGVDSLLLPLIKPPGELGVDIVVGEGQSLGNPPYFGGPLLGIFAVKGDLKLIRQMPGRLIGMADTVDGERCYTMILQTREQHIRRESATSNICTNEALTAITSAIYVSLMGKNGLLSLSKSLIEKAHKLSRMLKDNGFDAPPYNSPFFREFIVPVNDEPSDLIKLGLEDGYIIGRDISRWVLDKYGKTVHIAVNEFHTESEFNDLINIMGRGSS